MSSIVAKLDKAGKLQCPKFVVDTQFEVIMGSRAYSTNNPDSDFDLYGFCFPNKEIIFPHLAGYVRGFDDKNAPNFQNYQLHAIQFNDKEYGVDIYNIVAYFRLLMENNPNIVDSLFVNPECILHITKAGQMVRDNRKLFIHKGCYHKLRGYAHSQLKKAEEKSPIGKRYDSFIKWGFDLKFASHIVRLADECEQLLMLGDLDLTRSREMQKAIRRGEMPLADIKKWFYEKEITLEKLYNESNVLPYSPDVDKIKSLLLGILEEHYGDLSGAVIKDNPLFYMVKDIREVLGKYGY